ncbi:MAG: 30S ribosomal protein S6 [Bradyrhizobiaceae bacterium]|nr:30S ribosomal protein S6 [Bradyrhizobiaceae bacterium]
MSELRSYESTYIMNAALEDPEIEAAILRVNTFIAEHGGKIREENKWGRRRLAYPIGKKYNGYYVHTVFELNADALPLMERFFALEESVMRHLTLQLDEKLHAFRKVRAEAQAARAAQMAAEGNQHGRPSSANDEAGTTNSSEGVQA